MSIANITEILEFVNDTFQNDTRRNENLSQNVTIPLYVTIFILSVVGNSLVIVTLIQNRRMRTVTNICLLNLSLSDLLLALFCMPFTLVPIYMKNFVFGPFVCVMVRYIQGVSVGVSCFTLVAISLERFFAICQPLHSRKWQTLSHAYKIIGLCWLLAALVMIPIAVFTKHITLAPGFYMCRERWPSKTFEKTYTILLDLVLLVVPLIMMTIAYGKVTSTLWEGIRMSDTTENVARNGTLRTHTLELRIIKHSSYASTACTIVSDDPCSSEEGTPQRKFDYKRVMRHSNTARNRAAKLRVIRMLFIVVVEFFICWTPLYTIQTWRIFHPNSAHDSISSRTLSMIFVLAYVSSCCNPITYCFMNKKFRQSFISALRCCHTDKNSYFAAKGNVMYSSNCNTNTRMSALRTTTLYAKSADGESSTV